MKKLNVIFVLGTFLFCSQILAASFPVGECDQLIQHEFYSLCYSRIHRQAKWTSHDLTLESVNGSAERKNNFRADPKISENPVQSNDYKGSGFDRGHMVPAGDMKISDLAMSETFFMSNMSPQNPSLNRGLWSSLESAIRSWVRKYGDSWVVTAPVLKDHLQQTTQKISIPEKFYKLVYFPKAKKMAAFLVPNSDPSGSQFWNYSVKVSEVENQTGLNFFSELPDDLEFDLENKTAVVGDF